MQIWTLEIKIILQRKSKNLFNPFPNKPRFLRVCGVSLLKTLWQKGEIISVFYLSGELSALVIQFEIVICNLFQFASLKFVVWERVNLHCPKL